MEKGLDQHGWTFVNIDDGGQGPQRLRDLWRQRGVGSSTDAVSAQVPAHGVVLIRIY